MSSKGNKKPAVRIRKKKSIRKKVNGTSERPRLVVFKSLNHIYAQLVDDTNQKTITGISSLTKDLKEKLGTAKSNVEMAKLIGESIAKKAIDMKFESVVFDRNGFLYHGRIKAVADGARKGGLKF